MPPRASGWTLTRQPARASSRMRSSGAAAGAASAWSRCGRHHAWMTSAAIPRSCSTTGPSFSSIRGRRPAFHPTSGSRCAVSARSNTSTWSSTARSGAAFSTTDRAAAVRTGVRLEVVTVAWMAAEAALAIGAGIAARSVLLTAFGFDSVIELLSGVTLLWRLSSEARGAAAPRMERIERRATVISAALLVLLSLYPVVVGVVGLLARHHPAGYALGVGGADIAETMTCAYMAAATLAGAGLNLVFGLWWAEYVAALALLFFIVRETREAVESARGGEHHDHHESCETQKSRALDG